MLITHTRTPNFFFESLRNLGNFEPCIRAYVQIYFQYYAACLLLMAAHGTIAGRIGLMLIAINIAVGE